MGITFSANPQQGYHLFRATLKPLGDSGVDGSVLVYDSNNMVAYAGKGNGLQAGPVVRPRMVCYFFAAWS